MKKLLGLILSACLLVVFAAGCSSGEKTKAAAPEAKQEAKAGAKVMKLGTANARDRSV